MPVGVPAAFTESVADPLGELLRPLRPHARPVHHVRRRGPLRPRAAGHRRRAGPARHRRPADSRRVHRLHFCGIAGSRRLWRPMVRCRCAQDPATAVAGRAASAGRARQHRGIRSLPAVLAAGGPAQFGHRRPGRRHRSVGRSTDSGLGGRAAGIRAAGARLPTRDARRAPGLRRGHLVGGGPDRRRRRLDRVPSRRVRAVDAGSADGDRVHRHPSSDHGHARRKRGLLFPSARRRRFRTVQTGAVGTDLGRLDHRRHVRPGARDAVRHPSIDRPSRGPGAPATADDRRG